MCPSTFKYNTFPFPLLPMFEYKLIPLPQLLVFSITIDILVTWVKQMYKYCRYEFQFTDLTNPRLSSHHKSVYGVGVDRLNDRMLASFGEVNTCSGNTSVKHYYK